MCIPGSTTPNDLTDKCVKLLARESVRGCGSELRGQQEHGSFLDLVKQPEWSGQAWQTPKSSLWLRLQSTGCYLFLSIDLRQLI